MDLAIVEDVKRCAKQGAGVPSPRQRDDHGGCPGRQIGNDLDEQAGGVAMPRLRDAEEIANVARRDFGIRDESQGKIFA
jgi:hypothetical protein